MTIKTIIVPNQAGRFVGPEKHKREALFEFVCKGLRDKGGSRISGKGVCMYKRMVHFADFISFF